MKVEIIKILDNKTEVEVLCRTQYGNISIFWIGSNPIEGEIYDVEFESDEILIWNRDIFLSKEQLTICDDNQKIKVVGDIESIDEDGYMVINMGESIMVFMTQEIPIHCGTRVKILIEKLDAYPIEY